MAVSKHNLWKRKKNGLMKLVRSHSDWLERRRQTKVSKRNIITGSQWWDKTMTKSDRTKPVVSNKGTKGSLKKSSKAPIR